jgi:hypothetical protein
MNKSHVYLPILLAGLLAAAGVRAQSAPTAGSSDLPPKAGEASTQTMGAPNAKTSNAPSSDAPMTNKDARVEGQNMGPATAATSDVPQKAGEASTTVQGKPNADPNMPAANKDMKAAKKDSQKEAQSIMGAAPATASAAPATASAAPKTRAEVVAELMGSRAAFDAARKAMRNQDTKHMGAPRS